MVKTRLPESLYRRVEDYAARNGLSVYSAVRKLIEEGLERAGGVYRLLQDDSFILSLIVVKLKVDPGFRSRLLEIVGEEL
ncbi:MAG: hypothetical protein DRN04_12425 [Thermoprotei archaeon]|nr:MAG: hypothetical protein DRN04_12425 [Thermoprotei archaeon]